MNEDFLKNKEGISIKVEVIGPEDWNEYRDIWLEALEQDPQAFAASLKLESRKTEEDWRGELLKDEEFCILAKSGSLPVSMVDVREQKKGFWHVVSFYTKGDFRKKGIGEEVIKKVLEEIKKKGGKKVTLVVNTGKEQDGAFRLYEKLGFKTESTSMYGFRVMGKDIAS